MLSLGLGAALTRRGLRLQTFKKGPDYIDPIWHGRATGRPCYNLDFHTQSKPAILAMTRRVLAASGAELALFEGNKGLFDGVDVEGSNASSALARLVAAPVLLVVDCSGITRGVAPLLLGYRHFEPDLRFAGVILNKVVGARQESKLRAAIERYTDFTVLGAVARQSSLEVAERHLGLVPANEDSAAMARIDAIASQTEAGVDLEAVIAAAQAAPPLPESGAGGTALGPAAASCRPAAVDSRPLRLGIARDAAFGFYYPDDLDALEQAGCRLLPFDTLHDGTLPAALDGLFIGGGFPETQMAALEANASLRLQIRAQAEAGLPVYGECGGLMYLSQAITWKGQRCAMVGAVPGEAVMHARPQGRGYVRLQETTAFPWPLCEAMPQEGEASSPVLPAHEFHHASLEGYQEAVAQGEAHLAFRVLRGHGLDGAHDGLVVRNVLAGFTHQRQTVQPSWPWRFAAFMRRAPRLG